MKTTTNIFHVQGMHCPSCPILIEDETRELPGIENAKASLTSHTLEITTGSDVQEDASKLIARINEKLSPLGYTVAPERTKKTVRWNEFKIAVPVALGVIVLFVLLQKLGIVNLIQANNVSYGTAFLIGLIASVSSCMAVVGGLILSMSAEFTKSGDAVRPQIYFHLGRLVSFFILGGVIGAVGTAFTLNGTATFILGMVIGLVMLALGLNLLDIFPWTNKLIPRLPQSWGTKTLALHKANHSLTPLLVGVATFFLPCGFTQSMQLYALTTGTFLSGALTMLAFALGTLPVLLLVSFSGASIRNKAKSGIFFKTAGIVVIFFAGLNIITSLTAAGIIPPLFIL